jgi:DNA-binding beta-propeller fold protein YncE
MKKQLSLIKYFFFIVILIFGCKRDRIPLPQLKHAMLAPQKAFVVCEGNYGWGNGGVSAISLKDESVIEDNFKYINNRNLGDVVQSITLVNDKYFIVVNNSNKIEVIDTSSFKSVKTITGFTSPRYVLPLDEKFGLVSDLYANKLYKIDLINFSIIQEIAFNGWSEKMLKVNDKIFVCNIYSSKLYVLNESTLNITDSIEVGTFANSMILDKNKKLWILSKGNNSEQKAGKLYRYNPENLNKEFELTFSLAAEPKSLCTNITKDSLWFIHKNVFGMAINNLQLPTTPIVTATGTQLFNGLGIEPNNSNIWISDAKDYQHKGQVFKYNAKAVLLKTYSVGIIPTEILFK